MKGLLLPLSSPKDLESHRFSRVDVILNEMREGELQTLFD
jgi:hypothetical protein